MKCFYMSSILLWASVFYLCPMSSDQWVTTHLSDINKGSPSDHLEHLKTEWKKEQPQGVTLESMTQSFWNYLDQSPAQCKPL